MGRCMRRQPLLGSHCVTRRSPLPVITEWVKPGEDGPRPLYPDDGVNWNADLNADVEIADLANFAMVFSVTGFTFAPDWEGQFVPIDAAGIVILNSTAVVTQLKRCFGSKRKNSSVATHLKMHLRIMRVLQTCSPR